MPAPVETALDVLIFLAAVYFALETLEAFRASERRIEFIQWNWLRAGGLVGVVLAEGALLAWIVGMGERGIVEALEFDSALGPFMAAVQVYVVLVLIEKVAAWALSSRAFNRRPAPAMAASFLLLIAAGTLLLKLPKATVSGITLVDALFTATSAVCVTGLVVVPTGSTFTLTGHIFLLALIQLGGLGLISFIIFFGIAFGRRLGIHQTAALRDVLNLEVAADLGRLVRYIVLGTFFFEVLGAALLYPVFAGRDSTPAAGPFFSAVFHAVSAFCNAGFSLYDANLVDYADSVQLMLTVIVLVIAGGIGFYVLMDVGDFVMLGYRRRRRLRLQSRLVLLVTGLLLAGGTVVFWTLESARLAAYPFWDRALIALFHSTSARTAGFNTIDTTAWFDATYFFVALLMFVGASPGGTGGGVKTATLGVLAAFVAGTLAGRRRTELFHRTIALRAVRLSGSIIMLSFVVVSISTFLLALTERAEFMDILFESVSAFATVGLSAGLTPSLSTLGKLVVSLTMLVGRIGPLTLAFALSVEADSMRYRYPEEDIMVG